VAGAHIRIAISIKRAAACFIETFSNIEGKFVKD